MKPIHIFVFCALASLLAHARSTPKIPKEVLNLIPKTVNINDGRYTSAKKEIESLVQSCGSGVFEGVEKESRCTHRVRLDDLFFERIENKTGLLQQEDWAFQDGVSWVVPSREDVPDEFDLRELMKNGEPEIRKQRCGDCWAWATHHGLEIARAVHDAQVYDHSIQSVLSCSRSGSCSGGYMSAVSFLKHGLPMEEDFPYAGTDKTCKYSSSQINEGWDGKIIDAPYIGRSLNYSRGWKGRPDGSKVSEMMAAMYEWQAPLVVTVSAYSATGNGVVSSCSSINSSGNHMVTIVGWDKEGGNRNAHVWNSWGTSHGLNGVSRLKWECGSGQLNRGLGRSARVVQYKSPCTPPDATQKAMHEIKKGSSVQIGKEQASGTTCSWTPTVGLDNPNSCVTKAHPDKSTEYHFTATNNCGSASSMTLVDVWGRDRKFSRVIVTPFGEVAR